MDVELKLACDSSTLDAVADSDPLQELEAALRAFINGQTREAFEAFKAAADRATKVDTNHATAKWLEGLLAIAVYSEDSAAVQWANEQIDTTIDGLQHAVGTLALVIEDVIAHRVENDIVVATSDGRLMINAELLTNLEQTARRLGIEADAATWRSDAAAQICDLQWTSDLGSIRRNLQEFRLPGVIAAVRVMDGSAWLTYDSPALLEDDLARYIIESHPDILEQINAWIDSGDTEGSVQWEPDSPFLADDVVIQLRREGNRVGISLVSDNGLGDMRHFATAVGRYSDLEYATGPTVDLYLSPSAAQLDTIEAKTGLSGTNVHVNGNVVSWPIQYDIAVQELTRMIATWTAVEANDITPSVGEPSQLILTNTPALGFETTMLRIPATWECITADQSRQTTSLPLVRLSFTIDRSEHPERTARIASALGIHFKPETIFSPHLADEGWKVDLRRGDGTVRQEVPATEQDLALFSSLLAEPLTAAVREVSPPSIGPWHIRRMNDASMDVKPLLQMTSVQFCAFDQQGETDRFHELHTALNNE